MQRAIDQVSGRINEPYKLTEENAWQKRRRYNYENGYGNYTMTYWWHNIVSKEDREITKEQFETELMPS